MGSCKGPSRRKNRTSRGWDTRAPMAHLKGEVRWMRLKLRAWGMAGKVELGSWNSSPTCLCPGPRPHTICTQPSSQHPECSSSVSATGIPLPKYFWWFLISYRVKAQVLTMTYTDPVQLFPWWHWLLPTEAPPARHPGLLSAPYMYQRHSHALGPECNHHPNLLTASFLTSFKTLLGRPSVKSAIPTLFTITSCVLLYLQKLPPNCFFSSFLRSPCHLPMCCVIHCDILHNHHESRGVGQFSNHSQGINRACHTKGY